MVKVWDVALGREVLSFNHSSGTLERVTVSRDGRRLATASWDGSVQLWDAESGAETLSLSGHQGRVWGVKFDPRDESLVSAGLDGTVIFWDARREEPKKPEPAKP